MKLGLSLSGGGVKGAAHIGVLKAFEERNIEFEYISGASSGGIIATLHAVGYSADEILQIFKENYKKIKYIEYQRIFQLVFGLIFKNKIIIDGLNSGESIEKIINKKCNKKNVQNINQINKKLLIPSVDVDTGVIYYFTSIKNSRKYLDNVEYINNENIGKVVRATCSYPGVFSPCKFKDKKLFDGGIRENVPWKELIINGAENVIAVTFVQDIKIKKRKNIIDIIESALKIQSHELSNYELEGLKNIIEIKTEQIKLLEYNKIDYLYEKGYIAGKEFQITF